MTQRSQVSPLDIVETISFGDSKIRYHMRHGTPSFLVLTQRNPRIAKETARLLADEIDGKRVIEIGAGIGFLAIEMAKRARSVIAIEVDPAWSWVFTRSLYAHKPQNLTWIFGSAETVADSIRGDVAVIVTRSGIDAMKSIALRMAPRVVCPFNDLAILRRDRLSGDFTIAAPVGTSPQPATVQDAKVALVRHPKVTARVGDDSKVRSRVEDGKVTVRGEQQRSPSQPPQQQEFSDKYARAYCAEKSVHDISGDVRVNDNRAAYPKEAA
ncbi:MAG: hypothetical protein HYY78_12115 [Betaproteobacteria bacterium]|nr:hypothetical protein [Betaproteobacteria bacterium]